MNIAILGAGAWGTALAISLSPRHRVTLWVRDAAQAAAIAASATDATTKANAAQAAAIAAAATVDRNVATTMACMAVAKKATTVAAAAGQIMVCSTAPMAVLGFLHRSILSSADCGIMGHIGEPVIRVATGGGAKT